MPFDLDTALRETIASGASDLHLKVPSPPHVRVAGELRPLDGHAPLTPEVAHAIKERVLTSELRRRNFDELGSADLSYYTADGRFRVSAYSQRGSAAFVFRVIPQAPGPEGLGIPEVVLSWADARRGLVVVTGPTGAGKSTTCAVLLGLINERRPCNIITIEDPIEFIHRDRRAIISQREVGVDAPSHHLALRAALRQDPDVLLVGEVRDEETAMTALRAAETGHLVLCTMHTVDAGETIDRFVDLFSSTQTDLARRMLSSTLVGVTSQRLVPAAGGGQRLNSEVLVSSSLVRDIIARGAPASQLREAISSGSYYGMRTFDQCLLAQVRAGEVSERDAVAFATSRHDFKLMLAGAHERTGAGGPRTPVTG